jgi:hypothetical protein
MEAEYLRRADEWVKWYMYHQGTTMPLEQKVEFQGKAIRGLVEMLARTVDQLSIIEEGHNRPKIILPTGLTLDEPIRGKQ